MVAFENGVVAVVRLCGFEMAYTSNFIFME